MRNKLLFLIIFVMEIVWLLIIFLSIYITGEKILSLGLLLIPMLLITLMDRPFFPYLKRRRSK